MTNRDFAFLAYRLAGLWFVATALIAVASVPSIWGDFPENRRVFVAAIFLPSLATLVVGLAVWINAEWFASRTCPIASATALHPDLLQKETILATAFTILGAVLIANGIPQLVNLAAVFVMSYTSTSSVLGRDPEQQVLLWSTAAKANLAEGAVRVLIGCALVAGPARLAVILSTIRKDLRGTLDDEGGPPDSPANPSNAGESAG
jgi:hypothetical protein